MDLLPKEEEKLDNAPLLRLESNSTTEVPCQRKDSDAEETLQELMDPKARTKIAQANRHHAKATSAVIAGVPRKTLSKASSRPLRIPGPDSRSVRREHTINLRTKSLHHSQTKLKNIYLSEFVP